VCSSDLAGIKIVWRACEEPLRAIAFNAGSESSVVVNRVTEGAGNFGFNAGNDTYGDLVEQGVIDPTKVTRTALTSAASVAGLLLTTECAINDIPAENKEPMHNPGMGMM
jgi:chaperonin GroEL